MSDTTTPPAPFISQNPGSFEDQGGAEFPSTVGDTMDWFGTTRAVGRQFLRSVAEGGMQDPLTGAGQDIVPPEETTPPDVLQKKWGIPGKLDFTRALPEDVAESMYGAKRDEIARADAIARRPAGLINSASRYGAQFVADLLDPVNIAATMIPVAPEIDLGVTAASPLIERMGARAVQGAVGGAAGMAPLAALKYGMGRQEGADYDGYNALADIATGAGIGAVLHVGGGALGDYLSARVRASPYGAAIDQSPEVRNAMLRTSVAQMADDRPVEVRPIFDSASAPGEMPTPGQRFDVADQGQLPLPEPAPDTVRFYHGGSPEPAPEGLPASGGARWTSPAFEYARDYRSRNGEPGAVWYVDMPADHPLVKQVQAIPDEDIASTGMRQSYGNLEVPEEYAAQMQPANQAAAAAEARVVGSDGQGDPAGEHPQAFDQALRSASGDRPPNPNLPDAEAAVKAKPPEQLQAAQQQVDDHEAFFQQADSMGALTEEVRAELESIHDLDTQASDYGKSALSAAGCIARGMSGEA